MTASRETAAGARQTAFEQAADTAAAELDAALATAGNDQAARRAAWARYADVRVWTREHPTGVRTYRWVPAAELDAYLAEVAADPDREVIAS